MGTIPPVARSPFRSHVRTGSTFPLCVNEEIELAVACPDVTTLSEEARRMIVRFVEDLQVDPRRTEGPTQRPSVDPSTVARTRRTTVHWGLHHKGMDQA